MNKITVFLLLTAVLSTKLLAQGKDVNYQLGEAKLKGYFAQAPKAKKTTSGVLILSAWMGINEHSKSYADKLSALGYHAFVADIYGEGNNPSNSQEAGKQAGFYKKDYKAYQERIKAGLEQLIQLGANPREIVVIGFCFGGTGALEAARVGLPVVGAVSFHGGLAKDSTRANEPITAKILVLHGADDPRVPAKDVNAFVKEANESKADWQFISYADAVHSFTDPKAGTDKSKGSAYNEKAAQRSWEHLKIFLKEVFGE